MRKIEKMAGSTSLEQKLNEVIDCLNILAAGVDGVQIQREAAIGDLLVGEVVSLNEKGFGFIACPEVADNVFFHHSQLPKHINFTDVQEGQRVQFVLANSAKGICAMGILLL